MASSSAVSNRRRVGDVRGNATNKATAPATPLFVSILEDCGCSLSDSEGVPAKLSTEKPIFQRQLTKSVAAQGAKAFLDSMTAFLDDSTRFKNALLPVNVADENKSFGSQQQESVVRMLLGVDDIQTTVIKILLEKLPEFDSENEHIFSQPATSNICKQIVHQLRWLDRVVSGKELAAKLMEMLTVTSDGTQIDIISSLPEIIEDADHDYVALELSKKLLPASWQVLGILECLSNLNISADVVPQIHATAMQKLASVDIRDMSVIVKFVLQPVTVANANQVVSELRDKLDRCMSSRLRPCFSSTPLQQSSALGRELQPLASQQRGKQSDADADSDCLVLDSIREALQYQPVVADAWMKILTNVTEVKVIDLLLLLLLYSLPSKKKQVVSLLQKQLKASQLTAVTLQGSFLSHQQAMKDSFAAYADLAGILMRSSENASWRFGKLMYQVAFQNLSTYHQQAIISRLITHIGSGNDSEIEASLTVLSELVSEDCSKMGKFACFLKGILDYLDSLSLENIKCIYHIMCSLSAKAMSDSDGTQDEVYMLVRKQLANGEIKYKRMGIAGALAIVRSLTCGSSTSTGQSSVGRAQSEQAITWLQQMKQCVCHVPEALALLMDELADLLQSSKPNENLLVHISERYTAEFQENFVVDVATLPSISGTCLNAELTYGLDSGKDCTIALNILPLILEERRRGQAQPGQTSVSARTLAPNFRLLRLSEEGINAGCLEGIDALLGCPLYIFNVGEVTSTFSSLSKKDQELVCDTTLLAINWLREVIGAFACQDSAEMKSKVLSRLHTIIELTSQLEKWLSLMPSYCPLAPSYSSAEASSILSASTSTAARRKAAGAGSGVSSNKKAKKKKVTAKKKKAAGAEQGGGGERSDDDGAEASAGEDDSMHSDPLNDEESASNHPSGSTVGNAVKLASRTECLRECDLNLLELLKCPLTESLTVTSAKNAVHVLTPSQLLFILHDLKSKLEAAVDFSKSSKRKLGQPKKHTTGEARRLDAARRKRLITWLIDNAATMRRLFESVVKHSQANVADVSADEAEYGLLENHETIRSCLIVFFQIFRRLASWKDGDVAEARATQQEPFAQKRLLLPLAQCHTVGCTSSTPLADVLSHAYEFVVGLSDHIGDLEVATEQVQLLCALASESGAPQLRQKTSEKCHAYLRKQWPSTSSSQSYRSSLQFILRIYVSQADDPLLAMEAIMNSGVAAMLESEEGESAADGAGPASAATYPCLSRQTFGLFYKVMLSEFVTHVKLISAGRSTAPRDDATQSDQEDTLVKWNLAVRMFYVFVSCIKGFNARTNLISILKYGRQVLEAFLKQGMPLLDAMFRSSKDDVINLLKNIQLSTRSLQHICSHSKIAKDMILIKHVPPMKKCLETFVYRVKALLAVNNCVQAFWLGNLKNRNLDGEEILSQTSTAAANDTTVADEGTGTATSAADAEDAGTHSDTVVPESPQIDEGSESETDDRD